MARIEKLTLLMLEVSWYSLETLNPFGWNKYVVYINVHSFLKSAASLLCLIIVTPLAFNAMRESLVEHRMRLLNYMQSYILHTAPMDYLGEFSL